ncbi:hypothetical protein D3C81_1263000 [compost metagenome]
MPDPIGRLAADHGVAFLPEHGDAFLEVMPVHRGGGFDHAQRAAVQPDRRDRHILRFDLLQPCGCQRLHLCNRAEQPLQQVQAMNRLIQQNTAVHCLRSPPGRLIVIGLAAVPANGHVHVAQLAEPLLCQRHLKHSHRRSVPIRMYDRCFDAAEANGLPQLLCLRQVQRHWLLQHEMLARPERLQRQCPVQPAGRADAYRVNVRLLRQHGAEVRIRRGRRDRSQLLQTGRIRIAHSH